MPDSDSILLKTLLLTTLIILANGCADQNIQALRLDPQTPFFSAPIISPVPNTAIGQRLAAFPDGTVSVAWWRNLPGGTGNLQVSNWKGDKWTEPNPVTDMANIADAQIAPVNGDNLAALFMVSKPYKTGGEVQDIYMSKADSPDNRWSTPLKANQEKETSGKTLPSLAAFADGSLLTAWIDVPVIQPIPSDHPKAVTDTETTSTLYVAKISPDTTQIKGMQAAREFCGCCPPALAADGLDGLLVYRGLQPVNIRDPTIMRIGQDKPGLPQIIHNDHWVFDGCPSSGPVIAVLQNSVAVAWTTLLNNKLIVRAAFSEDNSRHFAAPIDVELENATGVSGIAMESAQSALLVWTSSSTAGEMIKLARIFDDGRIEHRTTVHTLPNGSYKWPGPRMVKTNGSVIVGWHDEQGKKLGLVKVKVTE
ncbi:MAG: hypothetical protein PHH59_09935 [Methylovulum sp.]|uniref:hypothetical protein n=1 Tax=Methylovulum sp. TaxID=1916980 RepID=UPI002621A142|nr:hypothetical protein [Methylovulum sp.]MDD2724326.1 hypothetical protein [Methylovulum sp.]MDD5124969.1 hypothetical protein [Methylovulum sp.]